MQWVIKIGCGNGIHIKIQLLHTMILLGSRSKSRQKLLEKAGIAYSVVGHTANESVCCIKETIQETVSDIALHKMDHIIIPQWYKEDCVLLLTADTLVSDALGCILGKPKNKEQAREYLRRNRGTISCSTAFCVCMKKREGDCWVVQMDYLEVVTATLEFNVPEGRVDEYIDQTNVLQSAGAVYVDGFGAQFIEYINGSYTGVIGLPMFELRQALLQFSFSD